MSKKTNALGGSLLLRDDDDSHTLTFVWNESEAAADRTLNIKLNTSDRTIDLSGNLTVEGAAILDQDYSSDAVGVAFGSLELGGAGFTCDGFIDEDSMATDSATKAPSQQSVKAYVDASVLGGALTWTNITGDQTAAVNNGYICSFAGANALTLPTTFAIGSMVLAIGNHATNHLIVTAGAGCTINFGDVATSAAGSITADDDYATLLLVGSVANTTWSVAYSVGNFTVS